MRPPLSTFERAHGHQLGVLLAQARQQQGRSAAAVAKSTEVSVDSIRSVESGRTPTPGFLLIARIAEALELSLDDLHREAHALARDGSNQ